MWYYVDWPRWSIENCRKNWNIKWKWKWSRWYQGRKSKSSRRKIVSQTQEIKTEKFVLYLKEIIQPIVLEAQNKNSKAQKISKNSEAFQGAKKKALKIEFKCHTRFSRFDKIAKEKTK